MLRLLAGAALSVSSIACAGEGDGSPPTGEDRPFRDEWRSEFSAPFPYDGKSEDPGIQRIWVGESVPKLGAANRGDVIIEFDAPAGFIEVELRRFTFAGDPAAAEAAFGRIGVLAGDADGHDCTERWWDRCTLTLSYEGQTQPLRDGADMRIHLPPDYHHAITVEAHDVSEESDYPDRGNVCIRGFAGEADVHLDSGVAFVVLSDGTTPTPTCSPDQAEACEDSSWVGCGCAFGRLAIETRALGRSDMVIDVPPGLWGSADLTNVDMQGEPCDLDIDIPDVDLGSVSPLNVQGEFGRPDGAPATSHGYEIELRSVQCSEVGFVSAPSEFEAPRVERRGDLKVCSGCLGADSCERLLEDR